MVTAFQWPHRLLMDSGGKKNMFSLGRVLSDLLHVELVDNSERQTQEQETGWTH